MEEHTVEDVTEGVGTEGVQVSDADAAVEAFKPTTPLISYADFAKLQIKIGTIVTAELVPDADKLLRLIVDVGEESPRQIISGIREWFPEPGELVGKQCPFLVNLESRKIRGLESQGMILAVDDSGDLAILHPHKETTSGAVVR